MNIYLLSADIPTKHNLTTDILIVTVPYYFPDIVLLYFKLIFPERSSA